MHEWIAQHLPGWVLGVYDWPSYRLVGRCWTAGCGRLMILHSPWRLYACERTPLAIVLNEERYAELVGADLDQDQPKPAATIVV